MCPALGESSFFTSSMGHPYPLHVRSQVYPGLEGADSSFVVPSMGRPHSPHVMARVYLALADPMHTALLATDRLYPLTWELG